MADEITPEAKPDVDGLVKEQVDKHMAGMRRKYEGSIDELKQQNAAQAAEIDKFKNQPAPTEAKAEPPKQVQNDNNKDDDRFKVMQEQISTLLKGRSRDHFELEAARRGEKDAKILIAPREGHRTRGNRYPRDAGL